MIVHLKKTDARAKIPERATSGSAGFDLFALLDKELMVYPHQPVKIHTGIALSMPDNQMVGLVYPRSGLASKFGLIPSNCVGVIDSDYRGEIMVSLTNLSQTAYCLKPFERIAQLVFAPVILPELSETDNLDDTDRGTGGVGSTGQQ